MKLLVTILASFILFLSMKPGLEVTFLNKAVTDVACCKGECSGDGTNNEKGNEDNDNNRSEKSCNPFQQCCNGKIICQIKYQALANISEVYIEHNYPLENSSFLSKYNAECWHPPQIL